MSYTPNTWVARQGTGLNRYQDQNGDYITLTPAPESVTTPGTPFSVDWMNHLEQGVQAASQAADTAQEYVQTTYYVSTTGSDTTGDGSSNSPFATIAKAIAAAPVYTRNLSVLIQPGTYTENLSVQFIPFSVSISSADLSQTVSLASASIAYCQHVDFRGITFTGSLSTGNKPQLQLSYVGNAYIASCSFSGGVGITGVGVSYGSTAYLYNNVFNNCALYAIYCGNASTMSVDRPSGSGNGVLFCAEAAMIYYYNASSFLGTSLKSETYGGQVRTTA